MPEKPSYFYPNKEQVDYFYQQFAYRFRISYTIVPDKFFSNGEYSYKYNKLHPAVLHIDYITSDPPNIEIDIDKDNQIGDNDILGFCLPVSDGVTMTIDYYQNIEEATYNRNLTLNLFKKID
jgi:hypothetical protein